MPSTTSQPAPQAQPPVGVLGTPADIPRMIDGNPDQIGQLVQEAVAIQAAADAGNRCLTDTELARIDAIGGAVEVANRQAEARQTVASVQAMAGTHTGRRTAPDTPGTPAHQASGTITGGHDRILDDPRGGFQRAGEYYMAVRVACLPGGGAMIDERLTRLNAPGATTTARESVGADGGYLVPTDFVPSAKELVTGDQSLLARTDMWPTTGNRVVAPVDESTPWATSGGIQVAWADELDQLAQSNPVLKARELKLMKATALVPASDEVLEDAASLEALIRSKTPKKFVAAVNTAIVTGNGVARPLGRCSVA